MEVKVETIDNGAIIRFKNIHAQFNTTLALGIRRALMLLSDKVQRSITHGTDNVKTRSGRLRGSFGGSSDGVFTVTENGGNSIEAVFGSNLKYARIQEYGGTITPKRGKFLVFQNQAGEKVFARRVTIPQHLYLRHSLERNIEAVRNLIVNSIKDGIDGKPA